MNSIKIGNNQFSWDETGSGPAIVLLSGWCQDHRLFKTLVPELAKDHRVIRFDWRGHGDHREHDGDFDINQQSDDLVAFVNELKLDQFLPVSTSHGGWANIEITDRLGTSRVPKSVVIDWIMNQPNEAFFGLIDGIQDRQVWEDGRSGFFNYWIGDTENADIVNHVNNEMADYSYEMWARSGREIGKAYRKWGCPMQRMAAMAQTRPITHIYSQPFEPEYTQAQLDFAAENPWFNPTKLAGTTHFPTLEQPANVAQVIKNVLAK